MSKFKVGDEVRRINSNHGSLKLGQVGRVRNTDSTGVQIVGECDDFWHQDENLELVSEGPVRTITRREVVEWSDDVLTVVPHEDGHVLIGFKHSHDQHYISLSKKQMLSACMVMSQIAEAMDDGERK